MPHFAPARIPAPAAAWHARATSAALLLAAGLLCSAPVAAQTPVDPHAGAPDTLESQPAPGIDEPMAPVSPRELDQFAEAADKVRRIDAQARAQLVALQSDDERLRIQELADREMRWAIEEEGMTVSRYQEIYTTMQDDPALAESILQRIPGSGI